ncbi:DUF4328 domain-containing protein [Flavilitoribacter nigricans]|uniref:DUF4328 domain-containing protein n=1 Tax=Flavilitoribacter nigricans (strain ATCC 23147 / DSM 23189 / NBRC 102662 / NCIMB 1420 / SS-2) TaxID=1122177 RepID=A0A2D0NGN2_FLAN2|nr:DUF4328 domain-containing protein [Flavilitoribacter nigricans]PHN07651.1 hypothetical protein CRP01_06005 [Flavilitoribacter nigricans DSM 23189 = NBRC 102662]
METKLRPNQERARAIIIIFWVMLGVTVLLLISNFLQYRLLSSYDFDADQADSNDNRQMVLAFLFLAIYILSIVYFIRWFRRAYYNLHQVLPASRLQHTEGWAAGSWFVPILNLYRPYQIMEEIWEKTQLEYLDRPQIQGVQILGFWWALFLGNNFISRISSRLERDAETIDSLITVTFVDMLQAVVQIGAILITIKMIKETSSFEEKMYRHHHQEVDILDHLVDE